MLDDGLGLGWIAVGAVGFAFGFVLAKLRAHSNIIKLCSAVSTLVAGAAALLADTSTGSSAVEVLGRLAVFAVVWLMFGIVFTIGAAMGAESGARQR